MKSIQKKSINNGQLNELLARFFYVDGSLRDICILDTDRSDWAKLLSYLPTKYSHEIKIDGTKVEHIELVDFLSRNRCNLLVIYLESISVHLIFFEEISIEFNIDPKEFVNTIQITNLIEFMSNISNVLSKKVFLTEENCTTSETDFKIALDSLEGSTIIRGLD